MVWYWQTLKKPVELERQAATWLFTEDWVQKRSHEGPTRLPLQAIE